MIEKTLDLILKTTQRLVNLEKTDPRFSVKFAHEMRRLLNLFEFLKMLTFQSDINKNGNNC